MYKEDDGQIKLMDFISPFGQLDPNNRWVKMSSMIPWTKYEEKYKSQFCTGIGAPAIKYRMAMGALIIKQQTGRSDDGVLEEIMESPYKQYFIGLQEFTTEPPFSQSSMTNFRKYITAEMINELNEDLFRKANEKPEEPPSPTNPDGDSRGEQAETDDPAPLETTKTEDEPEPEKSQPETPQPKPEAVSVSNEIAENKGTLILDATCAPSDIAYPTDINLLNEARIKLEGMIDTLYPHSILNIKPRTYREEARDEYIGFIFLKNPGTETIREMLEKQLKYVKRDLKHIDNLLTMVPIDRLSNPQRQWLETIRLLYEQQLYMFKNKTHSVENRIVSIGQPHVRPIKRGKAKAPYEFGAKVSISLVDGFVFIDLLSWDSYNEETQLIRAVEAYKDNHGYYPERVLADQIYRNRNNRAYCKNLGIRLSGRPLGRPSATMEKEQKKQQARDAADRNAIEGKFGEGKQKYGLGRIMARIKDSCETVISLAFLCMNLNRRLRDLFAFFQKNRYPQVLGPAFSVFLLFFSVVFLAVFSF